MALLLTLAVMIPLWTAVLVVPMRGIVILQRNGLVNEALQVLGLTSAPLRLLYTEGAVILATTHVLVALHDPVDLLGLADNPAGSRPGFCQSRRKRLRDLPTCHAALSLPGVYSGVLMVSSSRWDLHHAGAAGGPETLLMATLIGQQTTEKLDWGLAGALSVHAACHHAGARRCFGRVLRLEAKG